ncbi:unnamed protein product [Ambrosiozyma monospora]|uniref:Unnamed protein product n=1 Tax=Ambrosiozyma monospora TaxID=43982 RepID=A0A9W6T0X7_AMBMO|nr:unnamed protein product [Ambrosiozyma monospora]
MIKEPTSRQMFLELILEQTIPTLQQIQQLNISINNIEICRPFYAIKNNICENKVVSSFITDFETPSERDINLTIDTTFNINCLTGLRQYPPHSMISS